MSLRKPIGKALKILAAAAAALLFMALIAFALLLVRPAREKLLGKAISMARSSIPGQITLSDMRWPSLGMIEIDGAEWIDGGDTLATVGSLSVSVDLSELFSKDVHVREIAITGVSGNIPQIAERLSVQADSLTFRQKVSREKKDEKERGADGGSLGGFPRGGSVPGIPSIAVERIDIAGGRIFAGKGIELIDLRLRCSLDLLHGSEPFISLEELTLDRQSSPVSTDSLWLRVDPAEPALEAEGIVMLPEGVDFRLSCHTEKDGSFFVSIAPAEGSREPGGAFIEVGGKATVKDRRIASVDLGAEFLTPGTEELRTFPLLAGALRDIGELEGFRGGLKGHIDLLPEVSASAQLHVDRTSYLDTLRLTGAWSTGSISVDDLLLRMTGLTVEASGSLTGRSPELSASIGVDSMTWLATIMPGLDLPDGISAELKLESGEPEGSDGTTIRMTGRATAGGASLDSIDISGIIPAETDRPYEADLMVDAYGMRIMTSAMADLRSGIELILANPSGERPGTGTVYLAGSLIVNEKTGGIRINDLNTEGQLGRISVSADLDSSRNGTFDISGRWAEPPGLLRSMVSADSAAWDSLTVLWLDDGPFELKLGGKLSDGGNWISATGSAMLPGPRNMAPLMDKGQIIGDLGPLNIDLEGSFNANNASSVDGHVDLGRTGWIDTAFVSIAGNTDKIIVDTMLVAFEGLRISAGGEISGESLDLDASLSLADSLLVQRLGRLAGRELSMILDASCRMSGRKSDPEISIGMSGGISSEGLVIPGFRGSAERSGGTTGATLSMPEGLRAGAVSFDSLNAVYSDAAPSGERTEASVRLEAGGSDTDILIAFRIPESERMTFLVDTLHTAVSGQTLSSEAPFAVSSLESGGVDIDSMSLEGSIGSITADGIASPDSADIEAHIKVSIPEKPGNLEIADRLWPDSVTIDARAKGPARLSVNGRVTGITIGSEIGAMIAFAMMADTKALITSLDIVGQDRAIFSLDGTFPPLQMDGSLSDGPLRLDIVLDGAPVTGDPKAFVSEKPRQIGLLSGQIAARGTMSDPQAAILLDCSFIGGKELEKYRLSIDGGYAREEVSDTTLKRLVSSRNMEGTRAAAEKRTTGLSAGLTLTKSGSSVFTGILEYPLRVSLMPFELDRLDSGEMLLEVVSGKLALTDLDPLLPPDMDLEGFAEIELKAEGRVDNPGFDGRITTEEMSLAVANDLQASPTVDLEIGGDLIRPSVKGTIVIERALLRIPEMKESLLDAEGESLLWEAADSFRIAADTAAAAAAKLDTISAESPYGFEGMDLDVTITIPNSFRIESEKLNLELEGTLNIRQQGITPIITGELKPRKGRLTFMGRYFEIQRGSVFFYGGDEMNPSFDLTMTARVKDYDITIKLTGSALEPEIELTSDPARSESDIMSLLLFGRTMSDLNGSQSNLLQQRTTEILLVYGASKLEGEMSKRLGVDMFTFQQSTRDPNDTALMVGKYINRKTMLKYEQGIENTANFLINLEYQLTSRFKVETFIDQDSETGLELNWSNEY
jgi:hypothetical protein